MSDEKKYTAEQAARMVLKRVHDLAKSAQEKGVSLPAKDSKPGQSNEGDYVRAGLSSYAKQDRRKIGKENKKIKPNLPKSEDMDKCGDMEKDEHVIEAVKEIKGDKKVNEVMEETPKDKRDDVLRELREKKEKKKLKKFMQKREEKRVKPGTPKQLKDIVEEDKSKKKDK